MSKNILLIAVFGIIIIGGSVYYATNNKQSLPIQKTREAAINVPAEKITATTTNNDISDVASSPKKDAQSDEIIDYIVDGLSSDESKTIDMTLAATSSGTQEEPVIGTNF